VEKIFKAKNRPMDNPLIVHISKKEDINLLASKIPKVAWKLIDEFWPGPLTLVLKKKGIVPKEVTAGLDSVAIRMPRNKIALALIEKSSPIAAPSANLSTKPSGTSFKHILEDLNGKVDCLIKGNDSEIGLESTVLDLTGRLRILRPGAITFEQLKKILPNLEILTSSNKPLSPGMKYKHYSPEAEVIIIEGAKDKMRIKIKELIQEYKNKDERFHIVLVENPKKLARDLFKIFRTCDRLGCKHIIVPSVDEKGIGLAVMNRLRKAASKIVKA
jgi:L-threonylcarbamoyladenylate synthase